MPDALEHGVDVDEHRAIVEGIRLHFLARRLVRGFAGPGVKPVVPRRAEISEFEKPIVGIPDLPALVPPFCCVQAAIERRTLNATSDWSAASSHLKFTRRSRILKF